MRFRGQSQSPGADRLGSVGRPLGHVDIQVDAEGEIRIVNRGFLGYLHGAPDAPEAGSAALSERGSGHLDDGVSCIFPAAARI